jgi:hypothetical protein
MPVPAEDRWGSISVSPWAAEDGKAEAVGRCYSPSGNGDGHTFWGLARFRVPEGRIIDRVKLDLLPTSRPCWVPGHPQSILFAAGDGLLYRYDFRSEESPESGLGTDQPESSGEPAPRRVVWKCPLPSPGSVFLADPAWPVHPRLRHLLIATLLTKPSVAGRRVENGDWLWWLLMSPDGTTIKASGPLLDPEPTGKAGKAAIRRFPSLIVDRSGAIQLIYLTRNRKQIAMNLESLPIEIHPASGQPRVVPGAGPTIIAADCAPIAPVFLADGQTVLGVSRSTGMVVKHRVDPVSRACGAIKVARKD